MGGEDEHLKPGRKPRPKEDMFMAGNEAKPDVAAVMQTPEFQKMLAETVAGELAKIAKAPGDGAPVLGADNQTKEFFADMSRTIAAAVAEISDQGTHRKRVAPEILTQRAKANERMIELLMKVRKEKLQPEYKVVSKIYFGERVIDPYRRGADKSVIAQEIVWTGAPNEALRPVNKIAEQIFDAYRESIGSMERLGKATYRDSRGGMGVVAQDNRPHWMTPGGLVVKGDAPPKLMVGVPQDASPENVDYDINDPNAPEIRILGTVHPPARRNYQNPAEAMAARIQQ